MNSGRSSLLPEHSVTYRVASPLVEIPPFGWSYGINVRRPGPKRVGIEIGASVKFPVGDIPLLESTLAELAAA